MAFLCIFNHSMIRVGINASYESDNAVQLSIRYSECSSNADASHADTNDLSDRWMDYDAPNLSIGRRYLLSRLLNILY